MHRRDSFFGGWSRVAAPLGAVRRSHAEVAVAGEKEEPASHDGYGRAAPSGAAEPAESAATPSETRRRC
jgi:hypothetical protein